MNDMDTQPDGKIEGESTLKARHLVGITVVALAAAAFLYYWFVADRGAKMEGAGTGSVAVVPEGSRTVTLYFADGENPELVGETRQVAIGRGFVGQVGQVIRALVAGPEHGAVNTIPPGTSVLDVFYDPDTSTLFLDFSGEFIAGHPGGSSAEYHTVSAIMKTVSENFPEIQAVQVLVEGSQVGTIAGHINAHGPFLVRDWR